MSDTPRMKAAQMAAMEHGTGDVWRVGCDLERELNAANARIKRLEEALEYVVPSCANLHHPKRYRHKLDEDCPVEVLIRKAKEAKP